MADYYVDLDGNITVKKKKKKEESKADYFVDLDGNISPMTVSTTKKSVVDEEEDEDEGGLDFFQKSKKFDDGYQFGDVTETIMGTVADAGLGVVKGGASLVEGIGDAGRYLVGGIADKLGNDDYAERVRAKAKKNTVQEMFKESDEYLDQYSVLGRTSDAVMQGLGQVGAILLTGGIGGAIAGTAGATLATTGLMGVSSAGSGMSEAYEGNATDEEALKYGISKGIIDAGTELIFGGLGKAVKAVGLSKGLSSLDDMFAKKLSSKLSNQVAKNFVEYGVKASAEGFEEVLAGVGSAIAKKMTYMSEEELGQLVKDENLLEQFVVGTATSGMIQSGYVPGMSEGSLKEANKTGRDFISGYTQNEQTVIDKEVENRVNQEIQKKVAEAEKNGKELTESEKKLTNKERNAIYEEVENHLKKGFIGVGNIETYLGGDTFNEYKAMEDEETALRDEIARLDKEDGIEARKLKNEAQEKLDALVKDETRTQKKTDLEKQIHEEVDRLTANDTYLRESYNEVERGKQKFVADVEQYTGKGRDVVQRAIDSGKVNNTNHAHDLIDFIAKVATDKSRDIDFTDVAELEKLGLEVDPKHVNGYVENGKITLNIQSRKALNKVVGHELTHLFENTDGHNPLKQIALEHAKLKGDFDARYKALENVYKGVYKDTDADAFKAKIENELTADFVGDYIFSDQNFVNNLSVKNPNVFKRVYEEIKHLVKLATAGSEEAKMLLKAQKAFEQVYRGEIKDSEDAGRKLSMSSMANTFFGDPNMTADNFIAVDESQQPLYKQSEGYKKYVDQVVNNLRQTREDFDEETARAEVEEQIEGIVRVAVASKKAGYDILDFVTDKDGNRKSVVDLKDSKNRLLFSSLEPNSEYFTSNDISTICDKRKNFAEIYDDIVRAEEAKGVPKGKRFFDKVDNYFYIHNLLAEKGLTQPCRQCYVESMRKNLAPMASAFLELVTETNPNNKSNKQLYNTSGKNKGQQKSNNAKLREKVLEQLEEYGMSASDLNVETLSTADGLAQLKIQAPLIYEAFNSFYGQSKPKMPKEATPFRFGELTALLTDEHGKIKKGLVDKINSTGGFRLQSYSDFQIENFTDVLQVIFEAGTLGLNGHAYTKVPAFLEATEGTNLKRNISIFMYKDGDAWKIDRNDSFPYSLEEIYDIVASDKSGNTGIIAVSQNEDMSAWIMANNLVGYGIPFHKSGMKMGTVRDTDVKTEDGRIVKGYKNTKDHTRQQTEVWAKSTGDHKALTKVKNGINIYSFWDFKNEAGLSKRELIEKNTKAYIDRCYEMGYLPKFREYVMDNGKVLNSVLEYSKELGFSPQNATIDDISFEYRGYRIPYGYYKFLGDFNMFTPEGNASPQSTLSLKDYNFDKAVEFFENADTLRRNELLQQFANGEERAYYRDSNLTNEQLEEVIRQKRKEIVDEVVAPVKETKQFSLSEDNQGKKLTEEQKNYYKDNHEVFYENGKLKRYYHGTDDAGFFVFDPSMSDDGLSLFLTDNVDVASTYMDAGADNEFDPYNPPKEVETFDELRERFEDLGYEVVHEDGEYIIRDPEEDFYSFSGDTPNEAYTSWLEAQEYGDRTDKSMYYALYVRSTNPLVVDGKGRQWNDVDYNGETKTTRELAKIARDSGYDSLVVNNVRDIGQYSMPWGYKGSSQVVVVFDSNQVKSVYNGNPTSDPDIRYSLGNETAPTRGWNVRSEDILLQNAEDTAPVQEAPTEAMPMDAMPIQEEEPEETAPMDEVQRLYSLEAKQQETVAELDNVVETEDAEEASELPNLESYDTKLDNYRNALEGYKNARSTIETAFNEAIQKKEAEYNALKRKNTKKATNLLMQIENLKLRKSNNVVSLDTKIANVEKTIDKMENGIPTRRQVYHRSLVDNIKNVFKTKGFDFDEVLKKAKNLGTFATVDNTPQRVNEKALGYKEGQILNDLTVNKVAQNESKAIKWLNSYTDKKNGLLVQISKEYGIKPRSKESASAQMYGEGFYVDEDGKFIKYGDAELAKDFPDVRTQENIKRLAKDPRVRQIYDETLSMINESRRRNLYEEVPRRENYFLHFREMDDTFSGLGIPFNPNDIKLKDLPTDINGMTVDLQPGQPYFASARRRMGNKTTYDLVGGLERYLNSAKNQIYHIDDIQTLRALRNYIADTFGQAKGLENLDSLSEEEAIARIEEVYNAHLSSYAKFLNEEANVLAGKTSLGDRAFEGWFGRRSLQFMDTINGLVGKNMIGFNVSSALTNTVSMVQAFAKSNKYDATKAFAQTASSMIGSIFGKTDTFAEQNPLIVRRKGIQKMTNTPIGRIADTGYLLMSAIDNVSTEFVTRTKFNELTRKGMSEEQAHIEADKWASRILGDRSLGQQPHLYNSKTLGVITKFQLEVRNQLDSQFYDTYQEAKLSNEEIENALVRNAKTSAKVASTVFQLAVLQHLFGQAFESVAGYNPAFDIIEVLMQVFGVDDEEDDEDTVLDNIEQGFLTLLGDLPYTSTLTGGRIPISSALPISQFFSGKDSYGNEKSRWETVKEALPYYSPLGGYGQIKKTTQGLGMFSDEHPVSGSYTNSGNLRFPIEDTTENRIRSAVFGQYASPEARDYFDNERAPLKEKQIQEYKDLDLPIREYWDYREGLAKQDKLEDKFDYIAGLDLPVSKKNIMINNIVDRKEDVDMTNYDDFANYEEFDFATKNPEKYEFLQQNNISYSDFTSSEDNRDAYNWYYENPDNVVMAKAVSNDLLTYRGYAKDLGKITADKDKNGKSISGSRKTKVFDYINGLDISAEEKIILFKKEYNSFDDYNGEIINYLKERDDISRDEMASILMELGFTVYSDGTVGW